MFHISKMARLGFVLTLLFAGFPCYASESEPETGSDSDGEGVSFRAPVDTQPTLVEDDVLYPSGGRSERPLTWEQNGIIDAIDALLSTLNDDLTEKECVLQSSASDRKKLKEAIEGNIAKLEDFAPHLKSAHGIFPRGLISPDRYADYAALQTTIGVMTYQEDAMALSHLNTEKTLEDLRKDVGFFERAHAYLPFLLHLQNIEIHLDQDWSIPVFSTASQKRETYNNAVKLSAERGGVEDGYLQAIHSLFPGKSMSLLSFAFYTDKRTGHLISNLEDTTGKATRAAEKRLGGANAGQDNQNALNEFNRILNEKKAEIPQAAQNMISASFDLTDFLRTLGMFRETVMVEETIHQEKQGVIPGLVTQKRKTLDLIKDTFESLIDVAHNRNGQ